MTESNFRSLCQELMDAIDSGIPRGRIKQSPLAVRVDAALAQPEPQGLMPEVDDILRLAAIIRRVDGNHDKGAAALAEAILSHPDCSYDSPAIEPEPQGPSLAHEAYVAFVQICKGNSDDAGTYEADEELVRRALKRLSDLEVGRPAIEPVPGAKGE